jgi:hypothetical protein
VLVLPPLDQPTLERLNSFAEPGRQAEVAEFTLTQAALYEGVAHGQRVADVIGFLEERSEQPLPQNVRYTLEAWNRAFEQVQIVQNSTLLEGTSGILDQLQVTRELAPYVVRRLAPTRLLLADTKAVEQVLAQLGELPFTINYVGDLGTPLQVSADGIITQNNNTNHLLLTVALRRMAEALPDGSFRLTSERVRTAVAEVSDGLTGILKWLRTYAGELPAELVARLKLWALPTSDIALEQPLLLRLPGIC